MNEKPEGGCSCGEVRFRLESSPLFVHCCHCYWCQRESGSAFALNAMIEADRVTSLKGAPSCFSAPSNSGGGQDFWRCKECMTTVWSHYAGAGDKLKFVRVGALDAGHDLQPDIHIYTASKQPWVLIPDDQVAVDGYYDSKKYWPENSLSRMTALMQG